MDWTPGQRRATRALEKPYEGVPTHLRGPLVEWVNDFFVIDEGALLRFSIEFRLEAMNAQQVRTRCRQNDEHHLDVIEYLLETYCAENVRRADFEAAQRLEALLKMGNSAYRVKRDRTGLELRSLPQVQKQVDETVNSASGSAGAHLTEAWNQAYSRTHDPVKSYSESIKAVEAALAPVISPANLKATLGTMIGQVRSNPGSYKFVIADGTNSDGVQTALGLMRLLWEGQTSRHGGVNPTPHETVEQAQAAVQIAATLVQFSVGGAFSVV